MTKTIELNGKKFEVEDQKLRTINEYKIGDTVKVLNKEYSTPTINDGVIIDFLDFKSLPTIRVAVFETSWDSTDIKYISINKDSEKYDLLPISPDEMKIDVELTNQYFSREIAKTKHNLDLLIHKQQFFNKFFGKTQKEITGTNTED